MKAHVVIAFIALAKLSLKGVKSELFLSYIDRRLTAEDINFGFDHYLPEVRMLKLKKK